MRGRLSPTSFLLQHIYQFFFHILVNIPIAGKRLATLFMTAQCSYQIRILNIFIDITDKCPTSHVRRCNFINRSLFLLTGLLINHSNSPSNAGAQKNFFNIYIISLLRDKRHNCFTLQIPITVYYFQCRFRQRNPYRIYAIIPGFGRDIFDSISYKIIIRHIIIISYPTNRSDFEEQKHFFAVPIPDHQTYQFHVSFFVQQPKYRSVSHKHFR